MRLKIIRTDITPDYTAGFLTMNGERFCDTLEPPCRPAGVKIKGHTAIPAGTYAVNYSYSPKFRRKLPRLADVPNFTGILFHCGNTVRDTAGCILVGKNIGGGALVQSSKTEQRLCEFVRRAEQLGEQVNIEIVGTCRQ